MSLEKLWIEDGVGAVLRENLEHRILRFPGRLAPGNAELSGDLPTQLLEGVETAVVGVRHVLAILVVHGIAMLLLPEFLDLDETPLPFGDVSGLVGIADLQWLRADGLGDKFQGGLFALYFPMLISRLQFCLFVLLLFNVRSPIVVGGRAGNGTIRSPFGLSDFRLVLFFSVTFYDDLFHPHLGVKLEESGAHGLSPLDVKDGSLAILFPAAHPVVKSEKVGKSSRAPAQRHFRNFRLDVASSDAFPFDVRARGRVLDDRLLEEVDECLVGNFVEPFVDFLVFLAVVVAVDRFGIICMTSAKGFEILMMINP